MAEHVFTFVEETEADHVFQCTRCLQLIGFNKPGIGTPNAIITEEGPQAPPEAHDYLTPCIED